MTIGGKNQTLAGLPAIAAIAASDGTGPSRWCVLRTAGRSTLPLADSLNAAGLDAWTPRQTLRRPVPGSKPGLNGRRPTADVDAPILPTFVFAAGRHLHALASASCDPASVHPAFSIFRQGGRVPLVADRDIAGLQRAEEAATKLILDLRAADSREEQRKLRAAAASTERERLKLMRRETRHFDQGQAVSIAEASSFSGLTFPVENGDGHSAVMWLGSIRMKIDSWRLFPNAVENFQP